MNYLSIIKDLAYDYDEDIYLVGGVLRDYLLDIEIKDIDILVMSNIENFVDDFTNKTNSKKIILDYERKIYRIITDKNSFIDFSAPVGQDVITDLGHRDFTINSLAVLVENIQLSENRFTININDIIDRYNGIDDIKNKIIRVVNNKSIYEDPIRILRAYRFSLDLDFYLEQKTKILIEKNQYLLREVKNERVKEELLKIFSTIGKNENIALFINSDILEVLFEINTYKNKKIANNLLGQLDYLYKSIKSDDVCLKKYLLVLSIIFINPLIKGDISLNKIKDNLINYTFRKKDIIKLVDNLYVLIRLINDFNKYLKNKVLIYEDLYCKNINLKSVKILLESYYINNDNYVDKLIKAKYTLNEIGEMRKRINQIEINGNDIKKILNLKEGKVIGNILKEVNKKIALKKLNSFKEIQTYLLSNFKKYNKN